MYNESATRLLRTHRMAHDIQIVTKMTAKTALKNRFMAFTCSKLAVGSTLLDTFIVFMLHNVGDSITFSHVWANLHAVRCGRNSVGQLSATTMLRRPMAAAFYHKLAGAVQQPMARITARCARVRRGTAEFRPGMSPVAMVHFLCVALRPAVNPLGQSQQCRGGDGDAVFFGFFGGRVATHG